MALAVLAAGGLRAALPSQLRSGDARWVFVVVVVGLLVILIIGDPGRIDRDSASLRLLTGTLIGLISAVNAVAAVRLVAGIIGAVKLQHRRQRPAGQRRRDLAQQRDRLRPVVLGSRPRRRGGPRARTPAVSPPSSFRK